MSETLNQVVQILGAAAILAAFALNQMRVMEQTSLRYLSLNLAGGLLLLVSALVEDQWGFVALEVAWSGVSAWGLYAGLRKSPA